MRIAYFDCFSGAAGDMIVAALLDAGADVERLRAGLASLGLHGYALSIERVTRKGLAATRFDVRLDADHHQPHRHLSDILHLLERAPLPTTVRARATDVFQRLAQAEAAVHGTTPDHVHFHEVGAVDAILDVVGAVWALELLGVERVVCSPLPTGSGTVHCAHGVFPVPAPATAELLKGVPLAACDEPGELTTPTGAAVLTTLAEQFGPVPPMQLAAVGYGAGAREGGMLPNVLRVLIGEPHAVGEVDEITVLETNLDDSSPQWVAHCLERTLAEGALDAYALPIQMKKSRPGLLLTVLCRPEDAAKFEALLFAETTTFGIRRHQSRRTKLARREESVTTPYGVIRVKVATREGVETAHPEFDDCLAAARTQGVSVRLVMSAVQLAWGRRGDGAAPR
ncbi:MAG TPA: nickel pincer cofactor biosynthesis protein LarC [Phycisphaerae bacterium]|nr:nickel pincer cofactor biosynthesis protein LarC [Phycisphaerae bacterium]HNU44880.1 nickel pincer cofactor biosynthesis protein LarC [Phycisphaerae bacterium]